MSWARFDDASSDHLKVRRAGSNGVALWWASVVWCSRHVTDGLIPKELVGDVWRPLDDPAFDLDAAIVRLLEVGLWREEPGHYVVNDFLDYNPSKAEIETKRAKEREKKRAQRRPERTPRGSPQGTTEGTPHGTTLGSPAVRPQSSGAGESPRVLDADCPLGSPDTPSRPDPTRSLPTEERATRVRAPGGSSLSGLPDPLKEHETVGGFEHVWRRWTAEGRALGLTMPSHPRGRDYQLVEELERLALDAVPNVVARTRFDALEAFERLVGLAMRRYATQHREDAKRAPWKLGFVVSAWPELTKGAIPKEAA